MFLFDEPRYIKTYIFKPLFHFFVKLIHDLPVDTEAEVFVVSAHLPAGKPALQIHSQLFHFRYVVTHVTLPPLKKDIIDLRTPV